MKPSGSDSHMAEDTSPLRQAYRIVVPRPLRAGLHGALGLARRFYWRAAEAMSPPRQPGLFFWQLRRAPARVLGVMRGLARGKAAPSFDRPSFAHALARMERHELGIRSIINIGAGSGADSDFVQRAFPGSRTFLIEMDAGFEADYRKLSRELPDLAWAICAAGPHDNLGRMQKSDIGGVGGAIDLAGDSAAGAPVQFKRIDTLVREHALEAPYFLRFDTHGFELDVLAGAAETLKQTALIMMEVYNFKLRFTENKNLTFDEMSLYMKSLGFRCVDICDPLYRPGDLALWQMHLFFIRADHPLWADASYSKPAGAGLANI
jgi:FkbM family methyltransferase